MKPFVNDPHTLPDQIIVVYQNFTFLKFFVFYYRMNKCTIFLGLIAIIFSVYVNTASAEVHFMS